MFGSPAALPRYACSGVVRRNVSAICDVEIASSICLIGIQEPYCAPEGPAVKLNRSVSLDLPASESKAVVARGNLVANRQVEDVSRPNVCERQVPFAAVRCRGIHL